MKRDFTAAPGRDAALRQQQHRSGFRPTPLQQAQVQLDDALAFARERLSEREHRVFVGFACALVAREAARWQAHDHRIDGAA